MGTVYLVGAGPQNRDLQTPGVIPTSLPLFGYRPRAGEQLRFHFDMTKCIGCKCCVVACNEQNGNPAGINWRRVGEIEGGSYPFVERWHLSMGCNHCIEPSCLAGCPVKAYSKDAATGIVDHDPEICIGCQYCTWNCSYGVPQYNAARGVVGKCDMCHGRLNQGMEPACVNACPEGAITIESVNVSEWRANLALANAPGMPDARDSFSTTRLTLPPAGAKLDRVDTGRVKPEHVHLSLVVVLVLTQLAVGAITALWMLGLAGAALPFWSALLPLAVAAAGLAIAPAHLGRPVHAYRAWKGWRTSWLSREILAFSLFAGAAKAYAAAVWFGIAALMPAGAASVVLGVMGVYCSARIYMVRARPAWDNGYTLASFLLTAAWLGPLMVLAAGISTSLWLGAASFAAGLGQGVTQWMRLRSFERSGVFELTAAAELRQQNLRSWGTAMYALLGLALAVMWISPVLATALAVASEAAGRFLFFAAVVPKSVASTYLTPGGRA